MKDTIYYFHQTPETLAIELIKKVDLKSGDNVLEPFKGEGAFYNNLPDYVNKYWTEIEEGRDFRDFDFSANAIDWVIGNPPFTLNTEDGKRENAFFQILNYYADKVNKGIAFLGNDYCLSALTPKRMKELNNKGLYIKQVLVCSVKKWRGRYFYIILTKEPNNCFSYIEGNY